MITTITVPHYCGRRWFRSWNDWAFWMVTRPCELIMPTSTQIFFLRIFGWEFSIERHDIEKFKKEYWPVMPHGIAGGIKMVVSKVGDFNIAHVE